MRALIVASKVCFIKLANPGEVSKTANEFLSAQLRQAARAWLREVLLHVPEYTGTARGTFKPLGRAIGVAVPKGETYYSDERSRRSKLKHGKRVGGVHYTLGPFGNSFAEYSFQYGPREYKFTFTQNLPWAFWNDIYPAPSWITLPSNPPWFAINAGNKAFHN